MSLTVAVELLLESFFFLRNLLWKSQNKKQLNQDHPVIFSFYMQAQSYVDLLILNLDRSVEKEEELLREEKRGKAE